MEDSGTGLLSTWTISDADHGLCVCFASEQQHNPYRAPGDCQQLLNFLNFFHSPTGPLMLKEHLLYQNVHVAFGKADSEVIRAEKLSLTITGCRIKEGGPYLGNTVELFPLPHRLDESCVARVALNSQRSVCLCLPSAVIKDNYSKNVNTENQKSHYAIGNTTIDSKPDM
ncbi:hypothetical protein STEG23_022308 [Scotinomys teguina]